MGGTLNYGGTTTTTGFTGSMVSSIGHNGSIPTGRASVNFANNITYYGRRVFYGSLYTRAGGGNGVSLWIYTSNNFANLAGSGSSGVFNSTFAWNGVQLSDFIAYSTTGTSYANFGFKWKSTSNLSIYFGRGTTYSGGNMNDGASISGIIGMRLDYYDSCTAPTSPSAYTLSSGVLRFNWGYPTDDGSHPSASSPIQDYYLQTSADSGMNSPTVTSMGTSGTFDKAFTKGSTVYWRMGATNYTTQMITTTNVGEITGVVGTYVGGTPDAPTIDASTPSTTEIGKIRVNWTGPANVYGSAVDAYHIYYAGGAFIAQVDATSGDGWTNTYLDVANLTPGTNYSFQVYAHNAYGWSAISSASTAVAAPGSTYVYNGSAWQLASRPQVYNGSAWVPATSAQINNGSSWTSVK